MQQQVLFKKQNKNADAVTSSAAGEKHCSSTSGSDDDCNEDGGNVKEGRPTTHLHHHTDILE